jgi:hypothetical protein
MAYKAVFRFDTFTNETTGDNGTWRVVDVYDPKFGDSIHHGEPNTITLPALSKMSIGRFVDPVEHYQHYLSKVDGKGWAKALKLWLLKKHVWFVELMCS